MRYLVTARVKPGREADLLRAIEDGTLGAGSVAGDEYLRASFGNVLIIVVTTVLKELTAPLLVAELIFHLRWTRLQYWLRTLFVVPMVMLAIAPMSSTGLRIAWAIGWKLAWPT